MSFPRKFMPWRRRVAMVVALTTLSLGAQAQVPAIINYQGRLSDPLGNPLTNGYYVVEFRIWDDPAKTGAADLVWGRQFPVHVVDGGLFSVLLADAGGQVSTPAVPRTNDLRAAFGGPVRYLGLTVVQTPFGNVVGPVEIIPRQQLASAPFALQAQIANQVVAGSVGNASLQDGAVTVAKLGSGSVTTDKLAGGAVTPAQLAPNAVVAGKLAANSIATSNLTDAAVTTSKINIDGTIALNNQELRLRGASDANHSLVWNSSYDGPVLRAYTSGALTTTDHQNTTNTPVSLVWDLQGINVGPHLRASYTGSSVGNLGPLVVASGAQDNVVSPTNGISFVNNLFGGFSHAAIYTVGGAGYNGSLVFATDGDSVQNFDPVERMRITSGGRVGIGLTNPASMLHVKGDRVSLSGVGNYFNSTFPDNSPTRDISSLTEVVGLFEGDLVATVSVISMVVNNLSDERAKRVLGRSSGEADLERLRQIEVTDYEWIDRRESGGRASKKVIAQQVEKVLPDAVSRIRKVTPSVYADAVRVNSSPEARRLSLVTPRPHGLTKGDRVDVYTDTGDLIQTPVLEVASATEFAVTCDTRPRRAFVYGRWVDDFRVVDYDAISMLNVSATQELDRRLEERDATIRELKREVESLAAQVRELVTARPAGTKLSPAPASLPATGQP